jgi:Tfp pilus assembly protein PilF
MSLPQGFTPRRAFDEPFYRRTLNAGIAAVKGGDFAEARLLLRKAAEMKPTDPYHLFVNAQNGKVSGGKPVDRVKQVAFFLLVALSAVVLLLALYLLGLSFGRFGF